MAKKSKPRQQSSKRCAGKTGDESCYSFGREGERVVQKMLQRRGASARLHPGSRGAFDIDAVIDGVPVGIAVRTTRGNTATLTTAEEKRAKAQARRTGQVPLFAAVFRDSVIIGDMRNQSHRIELPRRPRG